MKHRKIKLNLKRTGHSTGLYKRGEVYPVVAVEKYADGLAFYTLRTPEGKLPFTTNDLIGLVFEWV